MEEKKILKAEEPKKELKKEELEKVVGGADPAPDTTNAGTKPSGCPKCNQKDSNGGDIVLPEIP